MYRAHSRFGPSQWEMVLLCNSVSHWLGTSLESALCVCWYVIPDMNLRLAVPAWGMYHQCTGGRCGCMRRKYSRGHSLLPKEKCSSGIVCVLGSLFSLTHLPLTEMAAILQTIFSNTFSGMKMLELWLEFHWNLEMAWHQPEDKPLSEPMMVRLLTQTCITRPQWFKDCFI